MKPGYFILGKIDATPPVPDFDKYFRDVKNPVTIALYFHELESRKQEMSMFPDTLELAMRLLKSGRDGEGAIMSAGKGIYVIKPGREKSVWGAANEFQAALKRQGHQHTVTAIHQPIRRVDDYVEIVNELIPQLRRHGDITRTTVYQHSLSDIAKRMVHDTAVMLKPADRVTRNRQKRQLEATRKELKTYFPSSPSINRIIDLQTQRGDLKGLERTLLGLHPR